MNKINLQVNEYELKWVNSWINNELKNLDKSSDDYKSLKYLQTKVECELETKKNVKDNKNDSIL